MIKGIFNNDNNIITSNTKSTNKKNRFLVAIEKTKKDKREYLAAVKAGKTVVQMEKEGLKFLNVSK